MYDNIPFIFQMFRIGEGLGLNCYISELAIGRCCSNTRHKPCFYAEIYIVRNNFPTRISRSLSVPLIPSHYLNFMERGRLQGILRNIRLSCFIFLSLGDIMTRYFIVRSVWGSTTFRSCCFLISTQLSCVLRQWMWTEWLSLCRIQNDNILSEFLATVRRNSVHVE